MEAKWEVEDNLGASALAGRATSLDLAWPGGATSSASKTSEEEPDLVESQPSEEGEVEGEGEGRGGGRGEGRG